MKRSGMEKSPPIECFGHIQMPVISRLRYTTLEMTIIKNYAKLIITDKLSFIIYFCIFAKNKKMEKFFEKLDAALKDNKLVKLTISKPVARNN